ncbi:hypothetical protein HU200_047199 [Digitaria exilis]|uniref:RING-type E3 ubiquitin transferase n=1 Tax=Digitaria exilis TaxID=1010633 RepID=A0A835AUV3_9POAL|nr:hypothetical protein HU200_047199 [Digitaria exilis]CAB3473879.1 unnamed protein product [Digitaria exilis]
MARLHSHQVLFLLVLLPAATAVEYSSLCRSPAAAHDTGVRVSPLSLPWISTGHFSGSGAGDLNFAPGRYDKHAFTFSPRPSSATATDDPSTTHLSATLTLRGTRLTRRHGPRHHSVSFDLQGYYYHSTNATAAELCMVGSGSYAREDGSGVVVLSDVVLHLSVPSPSSLSKPFVTGSLKGAEFNHTALVAYAEDDYAYGQSGSCPESSPRGGGAREVLHDGWFSCRHLRAVIGSSYSVEYMPIDGSSGGGFPLRQRHGSMYVNQMRCDTNGAVRAYLVFFANQEDDAFPSTSYHTARRRWRRGFLVGDEALVADGFWDSSRNRLCLKACRVVVRSGESGGEEQLAVGECGIGVSFWFPAVWSIHDRSVATGMIWNASSNSDGNTSAGVISVSRTAWSYVDRLSGITYNYTRVEEAKKHYDSMSKLGKETTKGSRFPGNYSYRDFAFGFSLKEQGFAGFGYASPVTIGSALVEGQELRADAAFEAQHVNKQRLLNVSYSMQYHAANSPQLRRISAEGVYDTKNGTLCMVACQVIGNVSSDCEVLVTVQFAPMGGVARERAVGTISSLRNQSDPLFFKALEFIGDAGMSVNDRERSSSRMDMESVMLLASMVLSCLFTGLQLRHVKHHPEALPATSVTMLVVLALGNVIPLVLGLQDMYRDSLNLFVKLTSGGALEINEFMQRVSTLLALVLQLRLLQLALSRRSADQAAVKPEDSSSLSSSSLSSADAERSTLWICLPLYALGAITVFIGHLSDGHIGSFALPGPGIVDDLVAYAGLVLDGFLLPQVVWNAVAGSTPAVRALSPWFYVGGTVIRAAPHAYDAFRKRSYVPSRRASSVYASPRDGLFGVGWDVVVQCVVALLAVLVFLQQRLGGAFLCCIKRRRPGGYEMVSTPTS